ncbi:hypothetical protein CBA19CS42_07525 [Caballeronia novacaledonica]|uniref:Uncharacterized protein n=1 Tax=Caballeronia novacaledonica TaxID=1544861 RepID=A0AA37MGX0_9BURK|nr:hypothetical protein CBA19CS42_07525 [Caballeronia novacaledonica]
MVAPVPASLAEVMAGNDGHPSRPCASNIEEAA